MSEVGQGVFGRVPFKGDVMNTRIESGVIAGLALVHVSRAYAQVVADDRVGLDGAAVEGLADRRYTLSVVERMLSPTTPRDLVDRVWLHLVQEARRDP